MTDNQFEAMLAITSGKEIGREIPLHKDKIIIGKAAECDIAVDAPEVPDKAMSIEKVGNIYLLKSLTGDDALVSEEKVLEKILEWGDSINIGNVQFELRKRQGGESKGATRKSVSGPAKKGKKYFRLFLITALLVLVAILIFSRRCPWPQVEKKRAHPLSSTEKKVAIERKSLPREETGYIIATARKRYEIAEAFYQEAYTDSRNIYLAILEWREVIKILEHTNPKPDIYEETQEKIAVANKKLRKRIDYLKKNAFVAYQAGRTKTFKNLLLEIMSIIPTPTDKDYLWAKAKLIKITLVP